MRIKNKKRGMALCLVLAALILLGCSGCGKKPGLDEGASPRLQDISLTAYNEGSEDSQYVRADLQFDQPVTCTDGAAEELRVTISGNRVKDDTLRPGKKDTELQLLLKVTAIESGKLVIQPVDKEKTFQKITSKDGVWAVYPFTVECLIPSGVSLATAQSRTATEADSAMVEKEVKGLWNIRNITWVKLIENGETVYSPVQNAAELLDGAVAVHGHDFLASDEETIAYDIADTLTQYFGGDYQFRAEGPNIVAEKKDSQPGDTIDLAIYLYQNIDGEGTAQ